MRPECGYSGLELDRDPSAEHALLAESEIDAFDTVSHRAPELLRRDPRPLVWNVLLPQREERSIGMPSGPETPSDPSDA